MTQAQRLLTLLASINMLNYLDRYVVPAVAVQMGGEFHLSHAEVGSLMSVFMVVYVFAAPVFGYLGDRYSRPRLVAFGIALWSLATAAAAFAWDYNSLAFTRALVGVGEAAYVTLGPAMLADLYSEKDRPRAFTWFYLAIPVGSALGYGISGLVAGLWGWRAAFLVAGIPGLVFAWRMSRLEDPPKGAMDTAPDPGLGLSFLQRLGLVLTNRVWLATTVCYVAYTFTNGALSAWAPSILQYRFQVSEAQAGVLFGALAAATGLLGTFAGGRLTDRWQRRWPDAGLWISGVTLLLAAPAVAAALHASTLQAAMLLYFLAMFLLFVNTSPVNAVIVSSLPASVRASGVALNVFLIHILGDIPSPIWTGARADRFRALGLADGEALTRSLGLVVPALVVSGVVLWWARRKPVQA